LRALRLGMLAKMTTASLAAVAGLAVLVHVWRRRDWWVVGRAAICVGAPILVLNGWWLVRNMRLYGANDPMGWKMFVRAGPSMLRTLPIRDEIGWYVRHQFASFWGSFGWTTVRMPDWAYMAYGVLLASAVVGLGLLLLRRARLAADTRWGLALLAAAVIVGYASVFRLFFSFNMVVAHGRYLYPLLTPLAVLVATGISELLPATRRRAVLGALAVAMAVGSAACLLLVVRPAFALPQPVAVEAPTGSAASAGTGTVFDGRFRLVRHSLSSERLTAGQPVTVTLDWEALPANWQPFPSVSRAEIGFVHIVGADGEVIARVDQMPFGGVHPTLAWRPGHVYRQAVKLTVAPDAVTGSGAVLIGWYPENEPQSRLPVSVDGQPAGDTVRLEHVVIQPGTPVTLDGAGATSRADRLGQGQGTRLAGYRLDGQVRPGGTVTITLFWQPDAPVGADLAVFVHAVGSDGVPLATGDGPPQGGRYPMWLWAPGEIVPDAHVLALPAGTSLADVSLRVGWYDPASGQRAPAVRYDGAPWADNAVELPLVGSP
jgi:hypothetical protein